MKNQLKVAELTSGLGALVLGIGLGALFPRLFARQAIAITATGLLVHAFGMWDKHRLEAATTESQPHWVASLYWVCWTMVAALGVWLILS